MSTQTTTTQAASGAEGFVLVPKQATKAMLDAAYAAHDAYEAAETGGWGGLGSVYEAMVAAAPVTGTEEDHRELRAVMRRLSAAKNAGGIEDAEAQAQVLGHAVDACIGQIREFLATAPQPAGAERVGLGQDAVEAAAKAYYDGMIGRLEDQWPHHDGWAGKSETFKAKVRVHMARALEAASLPAALGSGEGTAGATLTGQATQQSPSPAVSSLAGECPSRGWRPITTAPKAWRDETGRGRYVWLVARYPGSPTWTDQYYSWRDPDGQWVRWPHYFAPTHWMDAPLPPGALAGEAAQAAETEGLGSRASDGEAGTPKSLATLTASQEQDGEVRS